MIMKKIYGFSVKSVCAAVMMMAAVGCSSSVDDGEGDGGGSGYDFVPLVSAYVDNVVIPTYADMKNKAWDLYDAVNTFTTSQTQPNLDKVCQAWMDVRAPWELSEAFLFGPCGDAGLNVDPNIDTWPFNMPDFLGILAGTDPINAGTVSFYGEDTRGYHTIEYLIFDNGQPRDISSKAFSARELQYLSAATSVLRNDCIRVWSAWTGTSAITGRDQTAVNEMKTYMSGASSAWDVETYLASLGTSSFSSVFKSAARPYYSMYGVIEEIIMSGIVNIADEVAETKIQSAVAEYNSTGSTSKVESQYAHNSLEDFTNNIISIRNSYYGTTDGTVGANSLSAFVRSQEGGVALDNDIKAAIQNSLDKINAIQSPFVNHLTDPNVNDAVTAVSDLSRLCSDIMKLM